MKIMSEQTSPPSEAELEILHIIWELEPVGVREVYDRIALNKSVGYTTVLKQMQRLTEKGVLQRDDSGGTHRYRSTVPESSTKQQLANRLLQNAFGGSALQMMMHAIGNDQTSPEELQALKNWLDQQISQP